MKNHHGKTIHERIAYDIDYARNVENPVQKTALLYKILGAVDMAVEFSLISFQEWEIYVSQIFEMI